MKEEQHHTQRRGHGRKTFNGWKWAFITLLIFIVSLGLYLVFLLQPVIGTDSDRSEVAVTQQVNDEVIKLSTNIRSDDAEWLMNTYLEQYVGADLSHYEITLSDQFELHGTVEFLSFDIPFSLYFLPYVLENGNIQLRAEAVEVGQFSLPVRTVMRLVANQMETPNFISINSEAQYITIDLDRLFDQYAFDLAMSRINLEEDDIQVDLYLSEETINETIKNFEETN